MASNGGTMDIVQELDEKARNIRVDGTEMKPEYTPLEDRQTFHEIERWEHALHRDGTGSGTFYECISKRTEEDTIAVDSSHFIQWMLILNRFGMPISLCSTAPSRSLLMFDQHGSC